MDKSPKPGWTYSDSLPRSELSSLLCLYSRGTGAPALCKKGLSVRNQGTSLSTQLTGATWPLGYCPQGAGYRLGHPVQQHNTSFAPTPFHLCQPFSVPSLLQGQFEMPPPSSLVQAAIMSCQQWFQSYSLGTSGAGSVRFNCNI